MLRQRAKKEEEGHLSPASNEEKPTMCNPKVNRFSTIVVALGVILVWMAMYSTMAYLNGRLPPIRHVWEEHILPGRFIGERAKDFLFKLAGIGVKVVGSHENEVMAVSLIEDEIHSIMNNPTNENSALHKIEYDRQKVTGSFFLAFSIGLVSHYRNVQNLVVKIGPAPPKKATSSLLVNCHFDSAPTSPGASDDGLNCAVMLEVLRQLSLQNTSLDNNIIFLFNGAEETPLQASHGFITQHKWAKSVRAFINLESCGAGGREVLFQAGPQYPWLIESYGKAAEHPSGTVLAEDIFQSGLVPSDTDFRIFRDYGKIPGLDFAHCDNGFVYHTRYDDIYHIEDGVFQHTGDNLLALVRHFSSSEILENTEKFKEGRVVFFDLAGIYMFLYSETSGIIINLATVMLSIYSVLQSVFTYTKVCSCFSRRTLFAVDRGLRMEDRRQRTEEVAFEYVEEDGMQRKEVCRQLVMSAVVPFLGLITGVCFSLITAVGLDALQSTHSWYSKMYLILLLYFAPTLIGFCLPPLLLNRLKTSHLCDGVRVQLYCNGVQLMWTIALFIAILTGFRSAYLLMIAVLITAITNCILTLINFQHKVTKWLTVYITSSVIPGLYFAYIYIIAMKLFIPISGRSGPDINPELVIGIIASLLCALIFGYVTPLILLVWKPWRLILGLFLIYLGTLLAVTATPFGFPFTVENPQRALMFHVERNVFGADGQYKNDSGLWLFHIDRRAQETYRAIPWFKNSKVIDDDCKHNLLCGLPFYYTRSVHFERNPGTWIPVPPPKFDDETSIKLNSIEDISPKVRQYNFTVYGPIQMRIFLSPKEGIHLEGWSFDSKLEKGPSWNDREVYIISYTSGLPVTPWTFTVDLLNANEDLGKQAEYIDIGVAGHYLDGTKQQREDLNKYLKTVPEWVVAASWAAYFKSYVF